MYQKISKIIGNKAAELLLKMFLKFKSIFKIIDHEFHILINKLTSFFRKSADIVLVGAPDYGNLGDQLICEGELSWIKHYLGNYHLVTFPHQSLLKDNLLRTFNSLINDNDIIFFQGGGNVNSKYMNCEKIRRKILKMYPDNKIIMFQQSISFSDTEEAIKQKELTSQIYNNHKSFTVLTRENGSYSSAKEMFPDIPVYLFPDMATFLLDKIYPSKNFERNGICFCIRNDCEKYYSDDKMQNLITNLSKKYKISKSDTHIGHAVSEDTRTKEIQKLVDELAHYNVIVTDRFHGVIFSLLSDTPCIALKSSDHKITDGIRWFNSVEHVFYASELGDVPEMIGKAYSLNSILRPDFSEYFENLYSLIHDIISK